MTIAEKLKAAWALIDSPEKWTHRVYARDARGFEVTLDNDTAVCFCSLGAILYTTKCKNFDAEYYLERVVQQNTRFDTISSFNDNSTYEEVASLWSAAIAKAEKEGV